MDIFSFKFKEQRALLIKLNENSKWILYLPCGHPCRHCCQWCCSATMRSCYHWWDFWRLDSSGYDHTKPGIALAYNLVAMLDPLHTDKMVGMLSDIQQVFPSTAAVHNRIVGAI